MDSIRQKQVCKAVISGYVCAKYNRNKFNIVKNAMVGHFNSWHKHRLGLLIALILSPRANDKTTKRVTIEFLKQYPLYEDMIKLSQDNIQNFLFKHKMGMHNNKSKCLFQLFKKWKYGNDAGPQTRAELMEFKGVGPKIAGIYMNTVFGRPYIGVDTHISKSILYIYHKSKLVSNIEEISYYALKPLYKFEKWLYVNKNKKIDLCVNIHKILFALDKYNCVSNLSECNKCYVPWKKSDNMGSNHD